MLVSVIIPTFRRPLLLRRAIESVFRQTHPYFEIIVVDDNDAGSADREATEMTVKQFADDPRLKYVTMPKHVNAAAARNAGLKNANGELICFLDDDDWYEPAKLAQQCKYLQAHPRYDAVACGSFIKQKEVIPPAEGDLRRELLLMQAHLYTPALMFRRQAIFTLRGFDESFRRHQDYELLMRYFRRYRMGVVRQHLVHIGANHGENMLHVSALEQCKDHFFRQFKNDISQYDDSFISRVTSMHYAQVFLSYLRSGDLVNSWRIFRKYCYRRPRPFFGWVLHRAKSYLNHKLSKAA